MLVQISTYTWVNPAFVITVTNFTDVKDERLGKAGVTMVYVSEDKEWIKSDWPIEKIIEQLNGKR